MAEDGRGYKKVLGFFSVVFGVVGVAFLGVVFWLKSAEFKGIGHDEWIVIVQGLLMLMVGFCGMCCACRKSSSGLKGLLGLQVFLALGDISAGMVIQFSCGDCFGDLNKFHTKAIVEGLFFGTAALMVIALIYTISLVRRKRRINVQFSANISA